MIAIATLLLVLVVSLLITRMASLALTHTGLSRQAAAFQARSAFTGVGFTTTESEKVVNHPVRRRILLILMLMGNAGIVTAIATLLIGYLNVRDESSLWMRSLVLALGLAGLIAMTMSRHLDKLLSRVVLWALKRYTTLNVRDYAALLHLTKDYAIGEVYVRGTDWMCNQTLGELRLADEGVVLLSINRDDGTFLGVPTRETQVREGDTLVVYGRTSGIKRLDERKQGTGGNISHVEAVAEQKMEEKKEHSMDTEKAEKLN